MTSKTNATINTLAAHIFPEEQRTLLQSTAPTPEKRTLPLGGRDNQQRPHTPEQSTKREGGMGRVCCPYLPESQSLVVVVEVRQEILRELLCALTTGHPQPFRQCHCLLRREGFRTGSLLRLPGDPRLWEYLVPHTEQGGGGVQRPLLLLCP
eukprot:3547345-Amphidinium_carterae.1